MLATIKVTAKLMVGIPVFPVVLAAHRIHRRLRPPTPEFDREGALELAEKIRQEGHDAQ